MNLQKRSKTYTHCHPRTHGHPRTHCHPREGGEPSMTWYNASATMVPRLRGDDSMKLLCKTIGYFLLALDLNSSLFALDADKLLPIKINADKIDVKADVHQIVYIGHVELIQGSTHLIADKAVTIGDSHDRLSEAVVYGNQTMLAHAWSETEKNKPPTHIYADVIHYYPDKHLVTLEGHAKVIQDKNSLEAPKINYNLETKQVTTESIANIRTQITFFPEKKS